jgi:hypothetical protein
LRRLSGMRVCVGTQRNHLSDGYSEHCELIRLYRGVAEACVARPLLSAFSLRGAKSPHLSGVNYSFPSTTTEIPDGYC